MTKAGRTKTRRAFTKPEDMQIVRLKAQRYTYAYIGMRLGRSTRSVESRFGRLLETGEAADHRAELIELGALGADA